MSRPGSHQTKIHEVRARNVSTAIIDHSAARALAYRQRAIELAEAARHENDKGQRRFLLDKAHSLVATADQMDPLPPAEPQIFK